MEELLQIKKTVIDVGLEREYRFFQISDMHLAYIDEHSTEIDINDHRRYHKQWDSLKRQFAEEANEFCDERYDVEPNILFEALARHAVDIKADAVIMSGDILDRIGESSLRYMERFLESYHLPVVYCPGNHGWIRVDGERINLYDQLKRVIKNPEYDSFDFGEFDIVTIDNGTKKITDGQLSFLGEKLKQDKKIVLVVHAPLNIGKFGESLREKLSPYFLMGVDGDCENAFKFNSLVLENSDKIIAVLAGHIHMFYEEKITENLTQYTTSSGLIGAGREIILR